MRRVLTKCLLTPCVSTTSRVTLTREFPLTFCRPTGLYLTVRTVMAAAVIKSGEKDKTNKSQRGRKKVSTNKQSLIDSSMGDKKNLTRGKGNSSSKRLKHEDEGEIDDNEAELMLTSEVIDPIGGNTSIWEEDGDDIVQSNKIRDSVTSTRSRRANRVASKKIDNSDELEDEYKEEEEVVLDDTTTTTTTTTTNDNAEVIIDEESRLLKDQFPDLALEYDTKANKEPIDEVFFDSARVVSWKCVECDYKWKSGVFVRTCLRTKCPQCEITRNPRLTSHFIQLWDHALNDPCIDPKLIAAGSNKSAYWRCPTCSTSFKARIKDMVADKAKCPSCSLLHLHADFSKDENGLLQEWHPLKNGDLQPSQVRPTDPIKLWWLCMGCGHEWEATLAARLSKTRRMKGRDCPVCHGKGKE